MGTVNHKKTFPLKEDEARLIDGCLKGDRRAQQQLYDKYKDAMFTLSYRITSDFSLAEDALQDAFIGVFRGIKNFKRQSTLGAWIKTIVVRSAFRQIKKEPFMQLLEDAHTEDMITWPEEVDIQQLEAAIQELPDGYRSVFVLVEVEGYKHKEVAEMLNISAGTSKSQLYHAKRQLRKRLQHFMSFQNNRL